jgi:hypothetical protein
MVAIITRIQSQVINYKKLLIYFRFYIIRGIGLLNKREKKKTSNKDVRHVSNSNLERITAIVIVWFIFRLYAKFSEKCINSRPTWKQGTITCSSVFLASRYRIVILLSWVQLIPPKAQRIDPVLLSQRLRCSQWFHVRFVVDVVALEQIFF